MLLTEDYTRQLTAFTSEQTLIGKQLILYLSKSHSVLVEEPSAWKGRQKRTWAKKLLCITAAVDFCLVRIFFKSRFQVVFFDRSGLCKCDTPPMNTPTAKNHVSFHSSFGLTEKGVCNAEQESASGCRSKERLWREVFALSMETWVTCTAGTCKPLRAAFVQRDRDGGCCVRRCLVQYWKILVGTGRCC